MKHTKYVDYMFETSKGKGIAQNKNELQIKYPDYKVFSYYLNYFEDNIFLMWELDFLRNYTYVTTDISTTEKRTNERNKCKECIIIGKMFAPQYTAISSANIEKHIYLLPASIAIKVIL
jgi:hypothetical protein